MAFLSVAGFYSCKQTGKQQANLSPRDRSVAKIDSIENVIKDSIAASANPNISLAMVAIKEYEYFAFDHKEDTLSPQYLFKAAQLYEGVLHDYPKAAQTYQKVYEKYPDFKNRPMMLFFQGNAYAEMQDTALAIFNFKRFIEQYPNHPFADDAQGMINFIRMDEAQMQQFFEQGQQGATARGEKK